MQQPESPVEVRRQIAETYGLSQEQVLISSDASGTHYQWTQDGVDGNMKIGSTGPDQAGLYYRSRPPSIGTVIGCLGTPDFYRAYYQRIGHEISQNSLRLDLYFVGQGVAAVSDTRSGSKQPPKLSVDLPMQNFALVHVSTPEVTMAQLNKNYSAEFRQQLKTWPGKLEDVVIEIDPDLTR